VSLPRTLSALRFSSFASFLLSLYIVFAIVFICLVDRNVTPDLGKSFGTAFKNFDISVFGVFNSIPLVIFSYMYQTNIPMIYVELEKKDLKHMWKVMRNGTIGATIAYMMAGIFGYVTFADNFNVKALMDQQNILKCYPDITPNYISLFGILTVVVFATPLTILPCKDTLEELLLKPEQRFTPKQNALCTFLIILLSFGLALAIPNIGDAMTILGATTNSGIGFILPIIFYLRMERKLPRWSNQRLVAYTVFVVICLSSVIEIYTFVYKKLHPESS
jgi:amino acid permease